ncbi:MAG: helix-turn-helix transcriptional regulator [Sedimenticolaceae bacterium]|jgi:DNA-binding XRE family transcriptional regulator
MSAQFIEIEGKQVVVIPADDYRVLLEKAEMLDDVAAYDRAKDALAAGDEELVPAAIVNAILDGENPVRVWRQHRGMSQVQLAEAADISQAYLAQIETRKREGTLGLYRSLADVLGVDLDDLVG